MVTIFIIAAFLFLSRLLFVPTLLGAFKLKQKVHKMDEKKWNAYLSQLSVRGYLQRIKIFFLIPVGLCSVLSYFLFHKIHDRKKSMCLSGILFLGNIGQVLYRMYIHRRKLADNIWKIKEAASKRK